MSKAQWEVEWDSWDEDFGRNGYLELPLIDYKGNYGLAGFQWSGKFIFQDMDLEQKVIFQHRGCNWMNCDLI